jgi:hypothetical protein
MKARSLPKKYLSRIYFDVSVGDTAVGRLIFQLAEPELMPLTIQNLKQLCTGERRPIDPACQYRGCAFDFSEDYCEGSGRYRWSHVLKGRGRNAVGRPAERIKETTPIASHKAFGGEYYGMDFNEIASTGIAKFASIDGSVSSGVVLTVPLAGPGRGKTRLAIVRVGESPQEWRERLLLNSAVVGVLVEGLETLQNMARQRSASPVVQESGVL